MRQTKSFKYVLGVTLVELMIALVISSILLLGVVLIYGSSKRTSKVNDEFARLQENGRIAMRFIVQDVRMSGFMGCVANDPNAETGTFKCFLDPSDPTESAVCQNLATGVTGYDATGTDAENATAYPIDFQTSGDPSTPLATGSTASDWAYSGSTGLPASFPTTNVPVAGSDILFVNHGDSTGIRLNADKDDETGFTIDNQGQVVTTNVSGDNCHTATNICAGDVLIASDCKKARVFQASDVQDGATPANSIFIVHGSAGTPGNDPDTWGTAANPDDHFLQQDTEIHKFLTYVYFVANNNDGVPALYRHDGISSHDPQELVDGIESMQVLYGVDIDQDNVANYYASANQVDFTDITKPIVSVRISLLARSIAEVPKRTRATNDYTLASTTLTSPEDGRLRKVFTSTVKIRNKGL